MVSSFIVLSCLIVLASCKTYEGYKVLSIDSRNHVAFNKFVDEFNLDVWGHHTNTDRSHVLVPPHALSSLQSRTRYSMLDYSIVNDKVNEKVQLQRSELEQKQRYIGGQGNDTFAQFFTTWRDYQEYETFITDLATQFPSRVKLFDVGQTYEKNTIQGVSIKIGARGQSPVIVYNGGTHAREWIGPSTVTYIAWKLASTQSTDTIELITNVEYQIVPVLNVDGFKHTFGEKGDRYWRKTRTPNPSSIFRHCIGTDPNRNWGYKWKKLAEPCSETWAGEKPDSQPCIIAWQQHLAKIGQPRLKGFIDFHSFGYLWMSTWGYTKALPPSFPQSIDLSKLVVQAISDVHGNRFAIGSIANIIYVATGSSADYVYGNYNTTYSYGVELRGSDFVIPASNIVPSGEEIYAGILVMGNQIMKEQ